MTPPSWLWIIEEVLEIAGAAEPEDVDAGGAFLYVEEKDTYSLVVLNDEVNVLSILKHKIQQKLLYRQAKREKNRKTTTQY